MKLSRVKKVVQDVLEQNIEARKDNFILVKKVYENLGIPSSITLENLTNKHLEFKLPSFESICRARRTIVKNYPELNANIDARIEEEEKYIEFAREN